MKVSIITIVFNNHAFIAECIRSVQSQTYHKVEHIVIDGGSTDGTQEAIAPFLDEITYYKSEKDMGLYDALNKGIKQATGDIIGIMHSDDLFYEPETIQRIVDTYNKTNADIVYAHGLYVERKNTNRVMRIYPSKPFRKRYLLFGWVPLHTTIYVRSELFTKYGLYDTQYHIAGDYEITLRWLTNINIKCTCLNRFVVKMRLGGKSTTMGLQKKKSTEDLHIINKYNLQGNYTLACKIARKIPQYIVPHMLNNNHKAMNLLMLKPRGKMLELHDKFSKFKNKF